MPPLVGVGWNEARVNFLTSQCLLRDKQYAIPHIRLLWFYLFEWAYLFLMHIFQKAQVTLKLNGKQQKTLAMFYMPWRDPLT